MGTVAFEQNPSVNPALAMSGRRSTYLQMKGSSDEELMELLKDGYHDALAVLFDRHQRLVLSVAMRILRDRSEAEDLMQDVFFEIFRVAEQFDPAKGSVKTWILQYAYHRSLNRRQYLNLRRFYDQQQISEIDVAGPFFSSNGSRGLTYEEWASVLQKGLATLNDKQRVTLELAYFRGLLPNEIAEHMKDSPGNIRHYYYRGLKKLKNFLENESKPEPRTS
jgi:RNA polymerase sigma-70 factor (ECF subfamily)